MQMLFTIKNMLRLLTVAVIFSTSTSFTNFKKRLCASERNVTMNVTYKVSVNGHLNRFRLVMAIPATIKNRQTINDIDFSPYPDSIYSKNGNSFAVFKVYDMDESFKINMKCSMTIYKQIDSVNQYNDSAFAKYLAPEKFIESDKPEIIKVAATLKQKSDIETVMKTFFYVQDNITYKKKAAIGAEAVLEEGVGKCMDFSDLFVALLRANKIPAKSVFGAVVENEGGTPGYHAWPEAYLKKQGWILFDPTSGHSEIYMDGNNFKMRISNKYIVLFEGRNEEETHLSRFRYSCNFTSGSEIKVKESYDISPE